MNKKNLRRLFTASVSGAMIISLASCSAAKMNTGKIPTKDVYAKAGSYSVTYGDVWDELKWDTADVLETQIENVVLNSYINKINIVLNNDTLTSDDDKTTMGYDEDNAYSDEAYKKLKTEYEERIASYVVQDIYGFTFSNADYWDDFDDLEHSDIDLDEAKYVDEIYTEYQIDSLDDGTKIADLLKNADYKNYEDKKGDYLKLAKKLARIYYPLYAKELLAYDTLQEKIDEALEDDDDDEDDTWGYWATSSYVSTFKSEYTDNFDLSAVVIDFEDSDDLNDTLRAFGLKLYNKKLYYIFDSQDTDTYTLTGGKMKYEDYIDYYDDFTNSNLGNKSNSKGEQICTIVDSNAILEIYIQIYNYIYGGYKTKLKSDYTYITDYSDLNGLRDLTKEIIEKYTNNGAEKLAQAIATLKASNDAETYFTADELTDTYGSTFKSYMYDDLDAALEDDELTNSDSCFTTSGQSSSLGTTIAYKLDEYLDKKDKETVTDETEIELADWYNSDRSSYEILELIQDTEKYPNLKTDIEAKLKKDQLTSSDISTDYDDAADDAEIKIYNEACEISYSKDHEDYSNVLKKNKNSNVLATIKYDDVTWNVNIYADDTDTSSVMIPGTNEAFGVFNYLDGKEGYTTAMSLLSTQMVKDTDTYASFDADDRELYETYIENILLNFSNDGLSSSGYDSDLGKYNFLMLYFHTADIEEIIDGYYRVQWASAKLLTDYSDDKLVNYIKTYSDLSKKNYFSLSGTRVVAYMDIDNDGDADEDFDWTQKVTDETSPFYNQTFEFVAKSLICDIYTKISASTDSHTDKASDLVTEFNDTAKVEYNLNPISSENFWAKYRRLGLNLKTEEFSVTNSSLDVNFDLKERLYEYATDTEKYQYYINGSYPTCYIEPIDTTKATGSDDDTIIATEDGYNLIMVTSGTPSASAEWTEKDNDEGILENIKLLYNDETVTIDNVFNDTETLNANQIKLYLIDYALNGSSTLSPSSTADAISTFLAPVVERFTGTETQRIILLNYMAEVTGVNSTNLYDVITFTNEAYNGEDGIFNKMIIMNERIADDYLDIYNDTTGTSDLYTIKNEDGTTTTWWDSIKNLLKEEA